MPKNGGIPCPSFGLRAHAAPACLDFCPSYHGFLSMVCNRGKSVGEFGALPYRSTVGRRKMAEFRTRHSDCERMLHLRAHTFAPLTMVSSDPLIKLDFI